MGESHLGKGLQIPERLLFCFASTCLLLQYSSGIYNGVCRCGEIYTACNVICLSLGNITFYCVFLFVGC